MFNIGAIFTIIVFIDLTESLTNLCPVTDAFNKYSLRLFRNRHHTGFFNSIEILQRPKTTNEIEKNSKD